jgi:hypothetical protein
LTCFLAAALLAFPIRFGALRALLLASLVAVWLGGAYLLRRRRHLAGVLFALGALPTLFLFIPGRPADQEALRTEYLRSLRRFERVPYVWGGETHVGIDCSGLCRAALIDALALTGLRTANPAPLREAASLWWNDCSARALSEEYQGRTEVVGSADSLNAADYTMLRPGDLAVTAGGSHILAFLGDRTWIQADPGAWHVRTVQAPSNEGYFTMDATLVRWTALSPPELAVSDSHQRPKHFVHEAAQ